MSQEALPRLAGFALLIALLIVAVVGCLAAADRLDVASTRRQRWRWRVTAFATCATALALAVAAFATFAGVRFAVKEVAIFASTLALMALVGLVGEGISEARRTLVALGWGWLGSLCIFLFAALVLTAPQTPEKDDIHGPSLAILALAPLIGSVARTLRLRSNRRGRSLEILADVLTASAIYVAVAFFVLALIAPEVLHDHVAVWQGFVPAAVWAVAWAGWRIGPFKHRIDAQRRSTELARVRAHQDEALGDSVAGALPQAPRSTLECAVTINTPNHGAPGSGLEPERLVIYSPPGWPAGRPLTAGRPTWTRAAAFGLLPAVPPAMMFLGAVALDAQLWRMATWASLAIGLVLSVVVIVARTRYIARARKPAATPALIGLATLAAALPLGAGSAVAAVVNSDAFVASGLVAYSLMGLAIATLKARAEMSELRRAIELETCVLETPRVVHRVVEAGEAIEDLGQELMDGAFEVAEKAIEPPPPSVKGPPGDHRQGGGDLSDLF